MPEFSTQSSVDIARRLEIRGPDSRSWILLLRPISGGDSALSELIDDLSGLLQHKVRPFDLQTISTEELAEALQKPREAMLFRKLKDESELLDVFSTNPSFEVLHPPLLHELLLA